MRGPMPNVCFWFTHSFHVSSCASCASMVLLLYWLHVAKRQSSSCARTKPHRMHIFNNDEHVHPLAQKPPHLRHGPLPLCYAQQWHALHVLPCTYFSMSMRLRSALLMGWLATRVRSCSMDSDASAACCWRALTSAAFSLSLRCSVCFRPWEKAGQDQAGQQQQQQLICSNTSMRISIAPAFSAMVTALCC